MKQKHGHIVLDNLEKLIELFRKELENYIVKDTYTRGKQSGLRKAINITYDFMDDYKQINVCEEKLKSRMMSSPNLDMKHYEYNGVFKDIKVINELIERANTLNEIVESKESAPMEAGRASWERKGILFALKSICDNTGVCDFKSLFENKE